MQYTIKRRTIRWDNIIKLTFIALVLVVVFFAAGIAAKGNDQRTEWEASREVITIYVESGDTLDELGYKYKPEWMDVREYREQVKELNNMESSDLYMGQELKLYK